MSTLRVRPVLGVEIATQKFIYLPSEEEMKTLPADLMPFSQPT